MTLDFEGLRMDWLNHQSAFRIDAGKIIYIDPWDVKKEFDADIILITHAHYDHLSPEDVEKLSNDDSVIIAPPDCLKKIKGNTKPIKPGEKMQIKRIHIEAVPAYNIKQDRLKYHPKENNWVGFVLDIDGKRIYHAGDTDNIPEMNKIKCDLAMLPIGGTFTMDGEEGAEAANLINPKIAIPMHWGRVIGSKKDVEIFRKKSKVIVRVME